MIDLRSFLSKEKKSVLKPTQRLNVKHDITALQYALDKSDHYPIVYVKSPTMLDGTASTTPLVTNLTASRTLVAKSLGISDHTQAAASYGTRTNKNIKPTIVPVEEASVHEIFFDKKSVNLLKLPALVQHTADPGPYLTAAHATTYDPDTLVDNTAIQRCWIKDKNKMSFFPYPSSHNNRNLKKFWSQGQDCPVVFWIGHHPAVLMGTQAKLTYPESHWEACGGLIGQALRLTPSKTFGDKIMVPADAEIVIEGYAPANILEADGPFGEYTGYTGPQVAAPIINVTSVSMRKNAIYHDYGSGLTDMLVPDNMAMEGKVFNLCKQVAPSLINVHVPSQGRRFNAYLQFKNPGPGEVKDALTAALSYRRLKMVLGVDDGIDIFNDSEIMFALATRVQWSRDSFIIDGLSGSLLDPSTPAGARTLSKIGVDASLPLSTLPNIPPPVPPQSRVPDENMERAFKFVAEYDNFHWPKS